MYKYRKKNIKSKTRDMLQSSMLKFSPFDYTDTGYLKHLAGQLNLRKGERGERSITQRYDGKQQQEQLPERT